ncbi:hypothetical protein ACFL2G_05220, partial [Candidatus Omnitrophota bacterium]
MSYTKGYFFATIMGMFRKDYSLKIVSFVISVSFLFTTAVYPSCPSTLKDLLRIPAGQKDVFRRLQELHNQIEIKEINSIIYPIATGLNKVVKIATTSPEIARIDSIMIELENIVKTHPDKFLKYSKVIEKMLLWFNEVWNYNDYQKIRMESEIYGYLKDFKDIAEQSLNISGKNIKVKPHIPKSVFKYGLIPLYILMVTIMLSAKTPGLPLQAMPQSVPVISTKTATPSVSKRKIRRFLKRYRKRNKIYKGALSPKAISDLAEEVKEDPGSFFEVLHNLEKIGIVLWFADDLLFTHVFSSDEIVNNINNIDFQEFYRRLYREFWEIDSQ